MMAATRRVCRDAVVVTVAMGGERVGKGSGKGVAGGRGDGH